jgi:hypothetical protein
MNSDHTPHRLLLILCAIVFLPDFARAAESGFATETGGVEIVLPKGWERLDQPTNFFVQKRALHAEEGIALSAGSFTLDLTLEQYVALGLSGLDSGPVPFIEKVAKEVGISKEEFEKALTSRVGRQLTENLKQASETMRFELLKVSKEKVSAGTRFEVHSKVVVKDSGQVIFSRQFIMAGSAPQQIVQITFASASKEILTQTDLPDSIRLKTKAK